MFYIDYRYSFSECLHLKLRSIIVRYACCACIAICVNLMLQRGVLFFGNDILTFGLAVVVGTVGGLLVKFILDSHFIFVDGNFGSSDRSTKFALYTLTGVLTTGLFWGTESTFWFIWRTDLMREIGALIGLSLGYFVKFKLDRRFVFKS